jgi:hypothetical protein
LRPVALPPAERTVGQLVAESVRFYGDHFWPSLALGVAPAAATAVTAHVSRHVALILLPTVFGAFLSGSLVAASALVLDRRPPRARLVEAWVVGWAVYAPVPFLVFYAYLLPGVLWTMALALLVPVLVGEEIGLRRAVPRALALARADWVHQAGSLITLVVVYVLADGVLAFTLRGFGEAAIWVAYFLASVVLSPLLFIGTALLYVDQAARIKESIGDRSPTARS